MQSTTQIPAGRNSDLERGAAEPGPAQFDAIDAARFRALAAMYHAAHFYPQELDFPDGVALIFIAPKGTRVSADLGLTVDAAIARATQPTKGAA